MDCTKDFKWLNWLPIKVCSFAWRVVLGRIPVVENLSRRGLRGLESGCVFCDHSLEDVDHLLFQCNFVKMVWRGVCSWFGEGFEVPNCKGVLSRMVADIVIGNRIDKLKIAILYTALWCIWAARNEARFLRKKKNVDVIVGDIQFSCFSWLRSRYKAFKSDWASWSLSPVSACNM